MVGLINTTEPLVGVSAGYYFDSGFGIRLDAERIGSDGLIGGAGPVLGSWEETVEYFLERPRGYGENFATDRRGSWTH